MLKRILIFTTAFVCYVIPAFAQTPTNPLFLGFDYSDSDLHQIDTMTVKVFKASNPTQVVREQEFMGAQVRYQDGKFGDGLSRMLPVKDLVFGIPISSEPYVFVVEARNEFGQAVSLPSDKFLRTSSDDFVKFPNDNIAFIIGPQLKSGSQLNPWPAFDRIASERGFFYGEQFPTIQPRRLSGTVSMAIDDIYLHGVGTHFRTEISAPLPKPYFDKITFLPAKAPEPATDRCKEYDIRDTQGLPAKQWRCVMPMAYVISDTELVLGEWPTTTLANVPAETIYDAYALTTLTAANWNTDYYVNLQYYDQTLVQYINYYRTENMYYLAAARRIADSWWASTGWASGDVINAIENNGGGLSPRNSSVGGLILRALDGRPEMWDGINQYVRYMFDMWLKRNRNATELAYGVRDGSYMLKYAALLAKVLPDTYPLTKGGTETNGAAIRAQYLADAKDLALNYYVRLQYPDGSWRW